jgi:pyruvate kinase
MTFRPSYDRLIHMTHLHQNHRRQTKILATIGPASRSPEMIEALIEAGANAFRINFSHGDHDAHKTVIDTIRAAADKTGQHITIMADLQGPKLRIGTFKNGTIALQKGQTFRFDLDPAPGDETRVCLPHPEVLGVLDVDRRIFLNDGNVRARVINKGDDFVEVTILSGDTLSDKKGLNIPDCLIPLPALTDKDKTDLAAALDMGVDWIAQSFVQTPKDVMAAKNLINGRAALMAKLEKPSAIENLDTIVALADGVMLARGDLGVEIPPEDVPSVQKRVVRHVREAGKPIVVATQMLESMIENARPTRAEASDVATAVYDGADCVMLSGETAVGAYPVRAVEIMARICRRTENDEIYRQIMHETHPENVSSAADSITAAAYFVALDIGAAFIVTYTSSGSTALRMARHRPYEPVLCLTPELKTARRLGISYGILPFHAPETAEKDFIGPARFAAKHASALGIAQKDDQFVMTAGIPFGIPGTTNILRIAQVG